MYWQSHRQNGGNYGNEKMLAGWSKICPGCNIGRKYPNSFIGKKVRNHWEKGCISHKAYVEMYGSEEPLPKKSTEKPDVNDKGATK
jgi:hypothetical protein